MQVPLEWKLSVTGNNNVKSVMSDLNTAFTRGQISGADYSDSLAKMGREANKVNNISRYQNQIFLSMHPNINKLSRAFSTFASVGRTALSILTAYNTLLISMNTQSSALSEVTTEISENRREFNRTLDPEKMQRLNEELAVLMARQKEIKDQEFNNTIQSWLQPLFDVGIILGLFKNHLGSIAKIFTGGGFVAMGGIFSAIALGVAFAAEALYKFLLGIEDMDKWREGNIKALVTFFTVDIPNALGQAGLFLTNFFLSDLPRWASDGWMMVSDVFVKTWNILMGFIETGINGALKGFSDFVNKIISGINKIISVINKAFKSNIPIIAPFVIQNISLPKIDNNVNRPSGSNQGVIGPSNTYVTVQGTVLSEREFTSLMDSTFKKWMKDRGFTLLSILGKLIFCMTNGAIIGIFDLNALLIPLIILLIPLIILLTKSEKPFNAPLIPV